MKFKSNYLFACCLCILLAAPQAAFASCQDKCLAGFECCIENIIPALMGIEAFCGIYSPGGTGNDAASNFFGADAVGGFTLALVIQAEIDPVIDECTKQLNQCLNTCP